MTMPMAKQIPRPRVDIQEPQFQAPLIKTLKLPEEMGRGIGIQGRPKLTSNLEDFSTPIQKQKANDLLRAFTENLDSVSPSLKPQPVYKPFAQLHPQIQVTAVDPKNHRIQVKSSDNKLVTVQLPPQLQVNAKGTGVIYTPPVFAASPKDVLAAAQNPKQVAQAKERSSGWTRAPVVYGKKPTKAEQDAAKRQALAAEQALQAQQAIAQQQAAQRAAANKQRLATSPEAKSATQVPQVQIRASDLRQSEDFQGYGI